MAHLYCCFLDFLRQDSNNGIDRLLEFVSVVSTKNRWSIIYDFRKLTALATKSESKRKNSMRPIGGSGSFLLLLLPTFGCVFCMGSLCVTLCVQKFCVGQVQ
jgi:hypothetical protein